MKISGIEKNQPCINPNFGHAIRVNICVLKPNGEGYYFVNPSGNGSTYKKLNAKIINWLNHDIISEFRDREGLKRKVYRTQTLNEEFLQNKLVEDLATLDSDYREANIARSVYEKYHLGYIATGVDVAVLENIKGATKIGKTRKDSLWQYGTTNTPIVHDVSKEYQKNAKRYIQHPANRLMKDGKEVMFELVFKIIGKKRGEYVYELDRYNFKKVKKAIPDKYYTGEDVLALKDEVKKSGDLQKTFKHIVDRILGINEEPESIRIDKDKLKNKAKRKTKKLPNQNAGPVKRTKRKKRFGDDTNQLQFGFKS